MIDKINIIEIPIKYNNMINETIETAHNNTVDISLVKETISDLAIKISSVTSGIKSINSSGSKLIFTLIDDTTISVTLNGLSDNNYSTEEKNKLSVLNSDVLSLFSYVDNKLLYNGEPIDTNVDLSNYYTKDETLSKQEIETLAKNEWVFI